MFHKKLFWIILSLLLILILVPISITFWCYQENRIFVAISHDSIPRLQALIKDNPNIVNQRDEIGETPLHYAAKENQVSAINFLLDHGASIDAVNPVNATPLFFAVFRHNVNAVKALVQRGANLKIKLHSATFNGCTVAHFAARYDKNIPIMKIFLKDKSILHEKDNIEREPLYYAIQNGCIDMMRLMIDNGADINTKDANGQSPLHYAVCLHNADCVSLLLEKGVNVNTQTSHAVDEFPGGTTPLHIAAYQSQWTLAEMLLSHGADPYKKDAKGKTPLDYARSLGDPTMLNILQNRTPKNRCK